MQGPRHGNSANGNGPAGNWTSPIRSFSVNRTFILSSPSITEADSSSHRLRRRNTSGGFKSVLGRMKKPAFEIVDSPSTSAEVPPTISKVAKAFVNSINSQQLSDFLAWVLYFDIVELPQSAELWYQPIKAMEIRGWIALGDFIAKTAKTDLGFDLVVLDSICDRLDLPRALVFGMLTRMADPEKMSFSAIAAVTNAEKERHGPGANVNKAVHDHLKDLKKLAGKLTPTKASRFDAWNAAVIKRLAEFINDVLGPQVSLFKLNHPVLIAVTSDQVPKETRNALRLNFLFQVMQMKRDVPLGFYRRSVSPGRTTKMRLELPASSSSKAPAPVSLLDSHRMPREEGTRHSDALEEQNHALQIELTKMALEIEVLTDSNTALAQKVNELRHYKSSQRRAIRSMVTGRGPSPAKSASVSSTILTPESSSAITSSPPIAAHDSTDMGEPASQLPICPRSLSEGTEQTLAKALTQSISSATPTQLQRPDVLSSKYEEIFGTLSSASPALQLSDPMTGTGVPASSIPSSLRNISTRASRPSGIIFSPGAREAVRSVCVVGFADEIVDDEEVEDWEEVVEDEGNKEMWEGVEETPCPVRNGGRRESRT